MNFKVVKNFEIGQNGAIVNVENTLIAVAITFDKNLVVYFIDKFCFMDIIEANTMENSYPYAMSYAMTT